MNPLWKWQVYEQVEGHASSRAKQRAVQSALLGALWRRSSSSCSLALECVRVNK